MINLDFRIGVILVTWNNKNFILRALNSLESYKELDIEIIVVDNCSQDGTVDLIKTSFPDVTLIVNDNNLGGTGGFNTGLKYVFDREYDFIWFLDNDAEVSSSTLEEMINLMNLYQNTGICGCNIYSINKKDFLVENGSYISFLGKLYNKKEDNDDRNKYHFVVFCCCLVRFDVIKKIGLIDNRYFLYWDDIDYCTKIRKEGYEVRVAHKSKAYHKPFLFGERNLEFYLELRNRLLFFSKYFNFFSRFFKILNVCLTFSKIFMFKFIQKDFLNAKKIFFGYFDFLMDKKWSKTRSFSSSETKECSDYVTPAVAKILILNSGNIETINKFASELIKKTNIKPDIFIDYDRSILIERALFNKVINETSITNNLTLKFVINMIKLLLKRYDCVMEVGSDNVTPYHYCFKMVEMVKDGRKYLSRGSLYRLPLLVISYPLGMIFGVIAFVIVYFKSFYYYEDNEKYK